MNVLSLFDGMSCGQIALNRLGIKYNNYFASEIDKYAMKVTQANFPNTRQMGSVEFINGVNLPKIDLLFGGSPCQGFSFAGKQLNFSDPRSKLFFEFVRILKETKPKYFLLENVKMKKESQNIITEYLGVEPIEINSNLVSAQNRRRLYWTNIPNIQQPKDKEIYLKDIIERGEFEKLNPQLVFGCAMRGRYDENKKIKQKIEYNQTEKSNSITTVQKDSLIGYPVALTETRTEEAVYKENAKSMVKRNKKGLLVGSKLTDFGQYDTEGIHYRKLTPIECERLQTVPDNYTNHVSNTQRYKMLGNGWTVDVIAHIFKNMEV